MKKAAQSTLTIETAVREKFLRTRQQSEPTQASTMWSKQFIFILVIGSFPIGVHCKGCSGRNYAILGNRELRLFNEKKTYNEAMLSCKKWGQTWHSGDTGRLAAILNEEEQICVEDMIANPSNYRPEEWSKGDIYEPGYYAGATDSASERVWMWANEQLMSHYTNWAVFEPNNYGQRGEDCLQLMMHNSKSRDYNIGKWIDVGCEAKKFFICERVVSADLHWGYNNNEHAVPPRRWPSLQGNSCNGSRQSPINIPQQSSLASCDGSARKIKNWLGTRQTQWNVRNMGRFIQIDIEPKRSMSTIFRGSSDRYYVDHMIVKWGDDQTNGSDHAIGGVRYEGELQVYHEPNHSGDRHAFAFLIGTRYAPDNKYWNELLNHISWVQEVGLNSTMRAPKRWLRSLLEDSAPSSEPSSRLLRGSVRYQGSLPYPPCTENVIWTLFPRPIYISQAQISTLRSINMEGGKMKLVNNFRPLQSNVEELCIMMQ